MNKPVLKSLICGACGIVLVVSFSSNAKEIEEKGGSILIPTGPCEVVFCPKPNKTPALPPPRPSISSELSALEMEGSRITMSAATAGPSSDEEKHEIPANVFGQVSGGSPMPESMNKDLLSITSQALDSQSYPKLVIHDPVELNRIYACQDAFEKYAPDKEGRLLNAQYWPEYKDKCFRKGEDFRNLNNKFYGQLISNLVGVMINNHPNCMGTLLTNGLVLTARHCFVKSQNGLLDPTGPLVSERVGNALIVGIANDGNLWNEKVVEIQFDPFDENSSEYSQFRNFLEMRKQELPNSLDFIVLKIQLNERLSQSRVTLGTVSQVENLQKKQRLIVGSFFWENGTSTIPNLYVDDLLSCLVREYEKNNGYLHHHCQTINGISGSPVFMFGNPYSLRLIGVHVSSAGEMDPSKKPKTGNEALVLPIEIFEQLLKV